MKAKERNTFDLSTRVTRPGVPRASLRRRARLQLKSRQAFGGRAGDDLRVAGLAIVDHLALAAGGEHALGRLADDDQVDIGARAPPAPSARRGWHGSAARRRRGRSAKRRSSCGAISVPSGKRMSGQPMAPNRMASALPGALEAIGRQGGAGLAIMVRAAGDPSLTEREIEPAFDRGEDGQAAAMTSGPMPSPGMTARWKAFEAIARLVLMGRGYRMWREVDRLSEHLERVDGEQAGAVRPGGGRGVAGLGGEAGEGVDAVFVAVLGVDGLVGGKGEAAWPSRVTVWARRLTRCISTRLRAAFQQRLVAEASRSKSAPSSRLIRCRRLRLNAAVTPAASS